jgi:hypothetical protein
VIEELWEWDPKWGDYTDNQIRTDDVYLEGRSYTYLTIPAILLMEWDPEPIRGFQYFNEGVKLFVT